MIYLTRISPKLPSQGKGIRLAMYQGECPSGTIEAKESNIKTLEKVVKQAQQFQAQIIAFPELYLTGYSLSPQLVKQLAEPVNGSSLNRIAQFAKQEKIAIVLPYPECDLTAGIKKFYDSILVINSAGQKILNYRKSHLFGTAEKKAYSPGNDEFKVVKIEDFVIGVLNCYEAEFPELSRILALKGAKLIIIPTAADYDYVLADGSKSKVPYPDVSHNLIPANAYTNKLFIAYVNRYGSEELNGNKWHYRGNSVVASPQGELLLAAKPEETLLIADCIPDDFGLTHPEGNYLEDRRPDLYKKLVN